MITVGSVPTVIFARGSWVAVGSAGSDAKNVDEFCMLLSAEEDMMADFVAETDFLEVADTPGVAEVDGLQP